MTKLVVGIVSASLQNNTVVLVVIALVVPHSFSLSLSLPVTFVAVTKRLHDSGQIKE